MVLFIGVSPKLKYTVCFTVCLAFQLYLALGTDPCPAGKYLISDTSDCEQLYCATGYYSDEVGLSDEDEYTHYDMQYEHCHACELGRISTVEYSISSSNCTKCEAGKHDGRDASEIYDPGIECTNCDIGRYNNQPGSYRNNLETGTGRTELGCLECGTGSYADQHGSVDCKMCPLGYARENNGNGGPGFEPCRACRRGFWSDEPTNVDSRGTGCKMCPGGRYSRDEGLISGSNCTECPAGTVGVFSGYFTSTGQKPDNVDEGCSRCKAGKFLNKVGQAPYAREKYEFEDTMGTYVVDCPGNCSAGKYSKNFGLSSNDQCSSCPAGRYGEEKAQPTEKLGCKYCPSGYHQSKEGQILCAECPLGKFTYLEKQETCAVCAANAYADVTGSKFCSSCPTTPAGSTYILDPGTSATYHDSESDCVVSGIVCDAHQRRLEDSCEDCSVGFQVADDQDSCAICPVGQYNDVPGQFCKECVQSSTDTTKLCSLLPGATSATAVVDETTRKMLTQPTNATNNNADDATVNYVQDDVINQVVQLEGDCKDNDNYLQNNFVAPSDGIPMEEKRMYYVLLAVAAFTTVLSHRCWPIGFKVLDVMFAKSHFIEDSHAMRSYDTRLGASFNLALIIAVAGICLFVWGEPNILATSTLVPSVQVKQQYNVSGYGGINISVQTYAPQEMSCADISVPREGYSSGLQCFVSVAEAKAEDVASLLTVCNVHVHCNTKSNFRGNQYIDLKLPDAFQTLKWQVVASRWSPSANAVRIQHTLVPSSNTQLSGTSTQPTVLSFSAVRSVFNDTRLPTNPPTDYYRATGSFCLVHGVQLLWRQTNRVETAGGSDSGNHFVQFQIHVEENEYRMTLSDKLTQVNRFSMIITYILSLIGVLKFVKIFIQLIIDKGTVLVYGNYNMNVPHDVANRMAVLEEHLIDHHDIALSMYKQHFESMGGGQLLGWEDRRGRRLSNKKKKIKDLDGNNSGVETKVDVEMVAVNASSDARKRQKSVDSLNPSVDTRVFTMANPMTPVAAAAAAAAASDKKQIAALKQSLAKQHHRIESLETMVQEMQRFMTASTVGGGGGGGGALREKKNSKMYYHDENSGDVSF